MKGRIYRNSFSLAVVSAAALLLWSCAQEPEWKAVNDKVMAENGVSQAITDNIPQTNVTPSLPPGQVVNKSGLTDVAVAPGITGKMYWGAGALVCWMTIAPGAEIPSETLGSERLMFVRKGSVEQLIDGAYVTMSNYNSVTNWSNTPHMDFVYLKAGAQNAVRAGSDGAEILEIYSPVRGDYIAKAGGEEPSNAVDSTVKATPTVPANTVLNYYDVQFTALTEPSLYTRIISGESIQCSFKSGDPGHASDYHSQAEERLMIVLRGSVGETIMDTAHAMQPDDIAYIPSTMVHSEEYGAKGCDILNVIWPPRAGSIAKAEKRMDAFRTIIPENSTVELVHDGEKDEPHLNFTEGPAWMDGRLYFSNMWFAPDFSAGSPEKSNTIRMDTDGSIKIISKNMQTNGLMPLGNGNLAVCDMFGHRVIEMNPNGKVVRTLAGKYEGVRIDGPNDLVIDAKGGIYFTDPQFLPGLEKKQPGRSVFYRRPDKKIIRVIEPGAITLPNGILLSPDGKTCYINNTRGDNILAYDVNGDGTLSNERNFCKLFVSPGVRENEGLVTGADGMTIDENGNLYLTSLMGLQIFDKTGEFIGIIHFSNRPVSAVFGGDDMKTIFCTCYNKIYKINTNVRGLEYPLK